VREAGTVAAGQPLVLLERPYARWSIARVNALGYGLAGEPDPAELAELAACPALAEVWREALAA
jgi:MOSC domain-containing protein YiiM